MILDFHLTRTASLINGFLPRANTRMLSRKADPTTKPSKQRWQRSTKQSKFKRYQRLKSKKDLINQIDKYQNGLKKPRTDGRIEQPEISTMESPIDPTEPRIKMKSPTQKNHRHTKQTMVIQTPVYFKELLRHNLNIIT